MNKQKLIAAIVTISAAIPFVGFAQETSSVSAGTAMPDMNMSSKPAGAIKRAVINNQARKEIKEERKEVRNDIKGIRTQTKGAVKDIRTDMKEKIKDEKQEFRGEVKAVRNNASLSAVEKRSKVEDAWKQKQADLEKARQERNEKIKTLKKETKSKIQDKRETLKTDLKKIKDERKAKVVENTDAKLEKINENRTNNMLQNLEQMEKVLAKITVRINAAKERGINVAAVQKASEDAKKAIDSSRTAVQAQAAKIYKFVIIDENSLGSNVGQTVKNLQNDLNKARETVKAAHDAVRKTAVSLAQTQGVKDKAENSSSSSLAGSSSSSANSSSAAVSSSSSLAASSASSL